MVIASKSSPNAGRRVLIDGTKLLDLKTDGIKRYVQELVCALAELEQDDLLIDVALTADCCIPISEVANKLAQRVLADTVPKLFYPNPENPLLRRLDKLERGGLTRSQHLRVVAELQGWKAVRSALKRWSELKGLATRRASRYDLVHLTLPNTWRHFRSYRAPLLTTVHDLSHLTCPQFQTRSNNASLNDGLDFVIKRQSRLLAVSRSTGSELTARLGVSSADIDVAHEGVEGQRFHNNYSAAEQRRVRQRYQLPEGRYLLSLGTIEPRKNLLNMARAFTTIADQSPTAQLVVAGRCGWGQQTELKRLLDQCPRIHQIGYVQEDDLPVLYSMCLAFCYASHYEGFGLPLLEAMSCGAPAIYGDNSAMPEVAGPAGLAVDSQDVGSIAGAMETLLKDAPLRDRLAQTAAARAGEFTWRSAAESTLRAYRRCLGIASAPPNQTKETARAKAA